MPYVYLIQPVELVGTNRYKVGMSSLDNLNRMRSYKNGTRYLFICECKNALYIERKLIAAFKKEYKVIGGKEYFEVDCELKMMNLFISIVMGDKNRDQPIVKELTTPKNEPVEQPIKQNHWMQKFSYKTI